MVVGSQVHPITQMGSYIESAHKRVEKLTGCVFGGQFLTKTLYDSSVIMDSELPTRALLAFESMQPENVFMFAHDIQKALYYHGKKLIGQVGLRRFGQGIQHRCAVLRKPTERRNV
ncbi:MAG: hypothetical protein HC896_04080 [Bacteroidales bacterium]|nr:hypothetical protein [Bacteroidales bacterium]